MGLQINQNFLDEIKKMIFAPFGLDDNDAVNKAFDDLSLSQSSLKDVFSNAKPTFEFLKINYEMRSFQNLWSQSAKRLWKGLQQAAKQGGDKNSIDNENDISFLKDFLNQWNQATFKKWIDENCDSTLSVHETMTQTQDFNGKNIPASHSRYIFSSLAIPAAELANIIFSTDPQQQTIFNSAVKETFGTISNPESNPVTSNGDSVFYVTRELGWLFKLKDVYLVAHKENNSDGSYTIKVSVLPESERQSLGLNAPTNPYLALNLTMTIKPNDDGTSDFSFEYILNPGVEYDKRGFVDKITYAMNKSDTRNLIASLYLDYLMREYKASL